MLNHSTLKLGPGRNFHMYIVLYGYWMVVSSSLFRTAELWLMKSAKSLHPTVRSREKFPYVWWSQHHYSDQQNYNLWKVLNHSTLLLWVQREISICMVSSSLFRPAELWLMKNSYQRTCDTVTVSDAYHCLAEPLLTGSGSDQRNLNWLTNKKTNFSFFLYGTILDIF